VRHVGVVVFRRLKLVVAVVGLVGLGATAGFASSPFTDVDTGTYYTDAVGWAFENGVTTGTSATTFSPEQAVTRAQSVTFMYRYDQNVAQPALDTLTDDVAGLTNDVTGLTNDVTGLNNDVVGLTVGVAALDTLGELSCTATQVAVRDGGWRCADPVLTRSYNVSVGVGERRLETAGSVGLYTSVAIGTDGNPVISHYDASNGDLELYVCDDAACTSGTNRTLETAGSVGSFTSVAIGTDGNPVISHYDDSNDDLELYVCDDAACSSGTNRTLETTGSVGSFTSVAIGSSGNPVISHHDASNGDLELYVCDDAACSSGTNRTLETTGSVVGMYTSVAIGSSGNPVISHHDDAALGEFAGTLELYGCADAACSSGTNHKFASSKIGLYTSVAIGTDGNPVISHYDAASGDLKVAIPVFAITGIAFE